MFCRINTFNKWEYTENEEEGQNKVKNSEGKWKLYLIKNKYKRWKNIKEELSKYLKVWQAVYCTLM